MKRDEIHMATRGFAAGTEILMADGTYKTIENIKVGDIVLGIPEDIKDFKNPDGDGGYPYHAVENYINSEVTGVRHYDTDTMDVIYSYGGEVDSLFTIAIGQGFLSVSGEFMTMNEIMDHGTSFIWFYPHEKGKRFVTTQMCYYELNPKYSGFKTVYVIETSTHTYIAGNATVHD